MHGRIISLFGIFFNFLSSASKILEYRFGLTFGQIFYDFSGNGRYAVNGFNSSVDYFDSKSTDRGIYLIAESYVTLPSNNIVSAMTPLTSTFSLVTWLMILNGGQLELIHLYSGSKEFWIRIYGNPLLSYFYGSDSVSSSNWTLGSASIRNNKWQSIISTFDSKTLTVYINGALLCVNNLSLEYQTQIYKNYHIWGWSTFMWNYLLLDTTITPSNYFISSSSVCLSVGGCEATCNPGIIDSNLGTGCLSIINTTNTYSSGVSCSANCSKSCSSTVCLDDTTFICPNGYYSFISGTRSYVHCNLDCYNCTQANTCSSCIALNASPGPSIGCVCNQGFYNTSSLSSSNSCYKCNSDCNYCNNSQTCINCTDPNSSPSSIAGCNCNSGYYKDSNSVCQPCNVSCITCSDALSCTLCNGTNTLVNSLSFCNCSQGYYIASKFPTVCKPCNSVCKSCSSAFKCLECKDPNSSPSLTSGCDCNPGYYKDSNSVCKPCNVSCITCSDALSCTVCNGTNTLVNSLSFCNCSQGYYIASTFPTVCKPCNSVCKSCSSAFKCLECKDPNSVPSLTSGCDCNPGYYKDSNSICQPCNVSCITCSDALSCTLCNGTNTLVNSLSFCNCSQGYYIASTFPTVCKPCNSVCGSCSSASNCSECIKTAFLVDSSCFCKKGYGTLENSCTQTFFTVSVSVDQKNSLTLIFEESTSLYASNLTLDLNNTNLNFTIDQQDQTTYSITPTYLTDIPQNSQLKIKLDSLVSNNNSLLYNTTLSVNLFETSSFSSQQQLQVKIAAAKVLASQGATIGLSVALGLGFINLDPSSLFNFMNTAEIFYSTTLFNLNFDPILSEFLIGMRIQSKIPKIFSYIIPEEEGWTMSTKYIKYGYPTNLFLLNTGSQLCFLFLLLLLAFGIFILSKKEFFKKLLKPIVPIFRYGVFLRFWVQTFLEILLSISVSIKYTQLKNTVQIVDFVLSIFALVRNS
jgi:Concanavalin A-like lectin/glucanases superfamily